MAVGLWFSRSRTHAGSALREFSLERSRPRCWVEAGDAESCSPVYRSDQSICGATGPSHRLRDSHRKPREMKVTEKDVVYVAELANLELSAEERSGMVRDLNSILGYVDRLDELDTSNVEPMAQISDRHGVADGRLGSNCLADATRDDILEGLRKSLSQDTALENTPDSDGMFFRVPKVIER